MSSKLKNRLREIRMASNSMTQQELAAWWVFKADHYLN